MTVSSGLSRGPPPPRCVEHCAPPACAAHSHLQTAQRQRRRRQLRAPGRPLGAAL